MSFHVFGFVLFKSKQTFGKWNLSLSEMWKMLSKNPKRGWSHTAYWIPTLLLSLYSFKCPPWQTSDIHSNYLVNRDLRPNCCAEGGLNVRVHIMSKHFYLESRYFAKVKSFQDDFWDKACKSVYEFFNIQPVCLWWLGFDYPAVFSQSILSADPGLQSVSSCTVFFLRNSHCGLA